jgi:hypothetical protein
MASKIGYSAHTLNERTKKAELESFNHTGISLNVLEKQKVQKRDIREF